MISVTVVVPLPAAIVAGVNVAVAPVGNPVAEKLIASGKTAPAGGVRTRL